MKKQNIAILGSTGSIGTQALDVILNQPNMFNVSVLTANSNSALLIKQAIKFKHICVVIVDYSKFIEVKESLKNN